MAVWGRGQESPLRRGTGRDVVVYSSCLQNTQMKLLFCLDSM
jgi:hypothetical protein